jgi:hypothetical protein
MWPTGGSTVEKLEQEIRELQGRVAEQSARQDLLQLERDTAAEREVYDSLV